MKAVGNVDFVVFIKDGLDVCELKLAIYDIAKDYGSIATSTSAHGTII